MNPGNNKNEMTKRVVERGELPTPITGASGRYFDVDMVLLAGSARETLPYSLSLK
jgi:hypothetical protein